MANWTKEGFIGKMFATFARFISPPGMPAPVLWGAEAVVRERFGAALSSLSLTRVPYRFDYPFTPAEVVEFFRENYGPTTQAFAKLGEAEATELRAALVEPHHGGRGVSGDRRDARLAHATGTVVQQFPNPRARFAVPRVSQGHRGQPRGIAARQSGAVSSRLTRRFADDGGVENRVRSSILPTRDNQWPN